MLRLRSTEAEQVLYDSGSTYSSFLAHLLIPNISDASEDYEEEPKDPVELRIV